MQPVLAVTTGHPEKQVVTGHPPMPSVPNRPGPRQGQADGLPRALDGTGR